MTISKEVQNLVSFLAAHGVTEYYDRAKGLHIKFESPDRVSIEQMPAEWREEATPSDPRVDDAQMKLFDGDDD